MCVRLCVCLCVFVCVRMCVCMCRMDARRGICRVYAAPHLLLVHEAADQRHLAVRPAADSLNMLVVALRHGGGRRATGARAGEREGEVGLQRPARHVGHHRTGGDVKPVPHCTRGGVAKAVIMRQPPARSSSRWRQGFACGSCSVAWWEGVSWVVGKGAGGEWDRVCVFAKTACFTFHLPIDPARTRSPVHVNYQKLKVLSQ